MAVEKVPQKPVPRGYIPPNSSAYKVQDGDSWVSIATKQGIDAWTLIYFNFKTRNPGEVNWYCATTSAARSKPGTARIGCSASPMIPASSTSPPPSSKCPRSKSRVRSSAKRRPRTIRTATTRSRSSSLWRKQSTLTASDREFPPLLWLAPSPTSITRAKGAHGVIDWFQDKLLLKYMPNFFIEVDVRFGFNSQFLNATKHDIGKGNIKLETARKIYDQYKDTFSNNKMDWSDLVDYILSDQGTVHIAALVIKKAKEELDPYIPEDYPEEVAEAIYVSYYKEGPRYLNRFLEARAKDPNRRLKPGDGCRVLLQRDRFLKALKIE